MIDYQLLMSDGQSVITTATTTGIACTSPLDLQIASANKGAGTPIWVVVEVDTALVGSSATLTVILEDSADDSTYATLLTSETYAVTACTAGAKLMCVPLPAEHARYIRMNYAVGTAALTAGAVNAYLTTCPPTSI